MKVEELKAFALAGMIAAAAVPVVGLTGDQQAPVASCRNCQCHGSPVSVVIMDERGDSDIVISDF